MSLRDDLRHLPDTALLPVAWIRARLPEGETPAPASVAEPTWRERIWTCPDDTLLGVAEIAEVLGRPASWVYRRTGRKGREPRLPTSKLAGEVVIRADDLRRWIRRHLETDRPLRAA